MITLPTLRNTRKLEYHGLPGVFETSPSSLSHFLSQVLRLRQVVAQQRRPTCTITGPFFLNTTVLLAKIEDTRIDLCETSVGK